MKLYTPPPPQEIYRITIRKQGEKSLHISVHENDFIGIINTLTSILKPHVNPFAGGKKTGIDIRRALGSENLESKSISFMGLSVEETHVLILEYLNKSI